MHNINKSPLIIYKDLKIFEAINKINRSKIKILFVVDKKNKLLGSVSSGDIRRSIRKKIDPNLPVHELMFTNPKYILKNNTKPLLKESLVCFPIIDKKRRIIDFKITKYIKKDRPNTIFIMAGGKGSRLLPLTKKTPKPLLKIKGIPIIEKIILGFRNRGFKNFIISVNYLGYKIKKYLGDGKKIKVNITYIEEKKFLGTAGSLSLINLKKTYFPIITTNSDLISEIDYNNLIDYHIKTKSDLTICAKKKNFEMPYGEILLDNAKVKKILEKPVFSHLVNAGVYVINKELVEKLVKNKKLMMNDFITSQLKKNKNIYSYPIYEKWIDIGSKLDFYNSR